MFIRPVLRLYLIINIHKITGGPFQENGYIINAEDCNNCIIIDPGDNPESFVTKMDENGLNPLAIVNTHGHIDHIHAVQPLKDHFSIPFYIHENEKMYLEHYPESCRTYGMTPNKKPEVDFWLSSETALKIGEYNFDVIFTPGHTPGGLCFKISNDIFTGDTLFSGSIGRTDFPGGDYSTLMKSLIKLINVVPGDTHVHSGHGPSTTIATEIKNNPFLIELRNESN